jgi:DNA-binding NtrC family response regulator
MLHGSAAALAIAAERFGGPRRANAAAHTVLVVDDDRGVRESLRFLLAAEGFAVSVADSVAAAARLLTDTAFEVVITDLVMPGGGPGWIHLVRSIQPVAAVIVLTAVDVESPAVERLRDAGVEVLAKPVPPDELLAALGRATAGGREG